MKRFQRASSETQPTVVAVTLIAVVLLAGCSAASEDQEHPAADESSLQQPATSDSDAVSQGEFLGQVRPVFLEQQALILYVVRGSQALLLRPTEHTAYSGVEPMAAGDGFGFDGRTLHSASTYRFRGQVFDSVPQELRLVSLETRELRLESIELMESGSERCTVYFGMLVPSKGDQGGFVPVLPEGVRGKTGVFVQDGTGRCSVVMANVGGTEQLTNSFVSDGPISMNRQAPWAIGGRE